MHTRFFSVCFALTSALVMASPEVLAQRGGGHGGGMGGGMGGGTSGGFGNSGMSSAVERGGPPAERGMSQGADRSSQNQSGGSKTPGELLQQNSKLSEGLAKLLPAGTNLQTAAAGFKNLGAFVAAVHVSHNLGIPFADLKAKIMGGDNLGEAIHALKPGVDAQVEARKAREKAEDALGRS